MELRSAMKFTPFALAYRLGAQRQRFSAGLRRFEKIPRTMTAHSNPSGPPWLQPSWRPRWRVLLAVLLLYIGYKAFSTPSGTVEFEHLDKVLHISAFACLACVAAWCWAPSRRSAWWVALGLAVYGAFIEVVQSQLPTREASLADWFADALGIALGLALAHRVRVHARSQGN